MANIEKKIRPEIFKKLTSGEMHLNLRLADFDIEHGNTIEYKEWDADKGEYTERSEIRTVEGVASSKQDLDFGQIKKSPSMASMLLDWQNNFSYDFC